MTPSSVCFFFSVSLADTGMYWNTAYITWADIRPRDSEVIKTPACIFNFLFSFCIKFCRHSRWQHFTGMTTDQSGENALKDLSSLSLFSIYISERRNPSPTSLSLTYLSFTLQKRKKNPFPIILSSLLCLLPSPKLYKLPLLHSICLQRPWIHPYLSNPSLQLWRWDYFVPWLDGPCRS